MLNENSQWVLFWGPGIKYRASHMLSMQCTMRYIPTAMKKHYYSLNPFYLKTNVCVRVQIHRNRSGRKPTKLVKGSRKWIGKCQ
jgi:hypothetical protein